MSRNGSGTYSLPESPFIPATPISSAAMNSNLNDIGDALTDSLSRTGKGGMQSVLALNIDGFNYSSDTDTGISRSGPNEQVITCGGTDIVTVTTSGVDIAGAVDATSITVAGNPLLPVGLGPLQWSGNTAPAGWVLTGATYLRASYPALWAFAQAQIALGNVFYTNGDGSTTFTIETMDGYVPAGVDASAARIASFTDVGDTAGASTVTLSASQVPTILSNVTASGNANNFQVDGSALNFQYLSSVAGGVGFAAGGQAARNGTQATAAVSVTGTSTSSNTGGASHPNVQPSRAFKYIVYAGA